MEKFFYCCCFQAFSTENLILKCHIKDYFKINGKQRNTMRKKGEYVKFKNCERKIKPLFIILTTSADISSYHELLLVLWLANAFSSSKSVRLMVLRQGPS